MMGKKGILVFVISFVLVLSITNVSAFSLVDWVKGIFEKLGITGNPVYEIPSEGLIAQYSFQQESYSGTAGDVVDSVGSNVGTSRGGVQVQIMNYHLGVAHVLEV